MSKRALVVGGSLGGLIAAHLLRTAGWDAVVFERNEEELASRGVGLGTHPQLIGILNRAGIDFDERYQHKRTFGCPRMRDDEIGLVDALVAE